MLILRFSSIGDIVLTTPVLRCLKEQLADVELHYCTKASYKILLEENPYIDKIHTLSDSTSELITELKKEQFDIIIDLHHNLRTLRIKTALKAKSFSFNKLNMEKWMMVNFKKNQLPDIHIVDRYLETVSSFGVVNDQKGLDYFIPKKDEVEVENLFPGIDKQYIAFAIGGQHATKQLPLDKLTSICQKINTDLILLGGKEDANTAERIVRACGENVYNGCGLLNLNQSASVVKQAKAVITHDTGMMHIAAAFQQKIISIWGNTIPAFGMYPYLPGTSKSALVQEVQNLDCRPCSKIGFDACPKGHFKCMNLMDEGRILESLRD